MTGTTDDGPFPAAPDDTRTAIMKATYEALCKHGYADLTIQRIGEEFSKSPSLLYHHYDGKDELLVEFLGYMLERFEEREVRATVDADPETQLRTFVEHMVPAAGEEGPGDFEKVFVELRAQAAQDEVYRAQFTRTRERIRDYLADVVADGVEAGAFRDVDPERVADLLVTVISGAMFERVTTNTSLTGLRDELERYIERCVLVEATD